ncbi:Gfo/Idh/MocA family oxidoreductase, partial [bacterium]|nr:Gfo/Idh/MocA family oxidoreductase [bacterium]
MRVLLCGCGSIGQRYIRLLRDLFKEKIHLSAWRTNKYKNEKSDFIDKYNVEEYYDYDEALRKDNDVVFVTNPTFLHVRTARKAVESDTAVFMEKPVGISSKECLELKKEAEQKKTYIYVGYCMRFHPIIQRLKKLILDKELGK